MGDTVIPKYKPKPKAAVKPSGIPHLKVQPSESIPSVGDGSSVREPTFMDWLQNEINSTTDLAEGAIKGGTNVARAALAGGADSATLGLAPHLLAAQKQGGIGMTLPLTAASAATTMLGYDNPEYEAMNKSLEEEKALSPGGALAGTLGGYVLPGAAWAKAAKSIPALAGPLSNFFGRLGLAAGEGAAQSGIEAGVEGRNPLLDMLVGGVAGGAGQAVLGELIPNVIRGARESDAPQVAMDRIMSVLQKSRTAGVSPDDVRGMVADAGPGAILGDVKPLQDMQSELLFGPNSAAADPLKAANLARFGEAPGQTGSNALSRLSGAVEDIPFAAGGRPAFLADTTLPYAGVATKHPAQLAETTKGLREKLSPQYTALLDKYKNTSEGRDVLENIVKKTMAPTGLADLPASLQDATDAMLKAIKKQAKSGPLNPRQVRALLTTFREKAYAMGKDADKGTAALIRGRIQGTAHAIEAATLDRIPGYSELNKVYKEAIDYTTAHDLGWNLSRMKPDALSTIPETVGQMPANVYAGFLDGLATKTRDTMQPNDLALLLRNRDPGDVAKNLVKNSALQDVLKKVLPQATADDMLNAAKAAVNQMASSKSVLSKSAAKSVQEGEVIAKDKLYGKGLILAYFSRLLSTAKGIKPFQPSAAATAGAARRMVDAAALGPKATAIAADALVAKGGGVNTVLDQLFNGATVPSSKKLLDRVTEYMAPLRTGVAASTTAGAATSLLDMLDPNRRGQQ